MISIRAFVTTSTESRIEYLSLPKTQVSEMPELLQELANNHPKWTLIQLMVVKIHDISAVIDDQSDVDWENRHARYFGSSDL
jgi:hypothetical protein